jgi:hypothetical protein
MKTLKGQWFQLRLLPDFHQGQVVWLKDFGFVQLFKTQLKEQQRFYIVHQDEDDLLSFFWGNLTVTVDTKHKSNTIFSYGF